MQKRNPVAYWMKLGDGASCHRIFGPKDVSTNSYLMYDSIERNEFSDTLLMQAASEGDILSASNLLASGDNANSRTLDGYTALMFAAVFGHDEIVRILLSNGADANMQSKDGMTALILAARFGHLNVVNNLLATGCNTGSKDRYGQTAFRLACDREYMEFRDYKKIAEALEKAGAR
jgi:ankyrin repeat protein